MALTTGNLLFDAQINNEKRSNRIFKDLSLNFNQNPVTKDITKVTDVEAIKRSVRNLISINHYETINSNFGVTEWNTIFNCKSRRDDIHNAING